MIKFLQGDIFNSNAQTLVATVNCVGIMGKGLAKDFKDRFPEMYKEYVKACKRGELRQGRFFIYDELDKKILCFPTKDNWKGPSKYEFIEEGLKNLRQDYMKLGITSIAIPPLGSGLGGLDWKKVKNLIVQYLEGLPIDIEIYEPLIGVDRVVSRNQFKNIAKVKLSPSVVYTGEIIRVARNMFPKDVLIGRLLLQKLAFFAQMAGLPIKLSFVKYNLGPFDYRLKFNVDALEGLYVRDLSPSIQRSNLVMLDEQAWLEAIKGLGIDLEYARDKILKAVDFLRTRNLRDAELLSSVLLAWVSLVSSGQTGSFEEVVEYINDWKFEKFTKEEIQQAIHQLADAGWMSPAPTNDPQENSAELISV